MNALLVRAHDAIASGDRVKAVVAVATLSDHRDQLTPAQTTDILERACVYGTSNLVDWTFTALGPFPYRGWALALALRCAREDVSRYLIGHGVDLLEDVSREDKYRTIADHEMDLSRHDLTRGSSGLLASPFGRSVSSEVFSRFTGREQLVGGSYSIMTDIAATCDLVGRLADEGVFDSVVLDDLLRAAVAHASEVMDAPRVSEPYAIEACLGFASHLVKLWNEAGRKEGRVGFVLGEFIQPDAHRRIIAFVCENVPEVFVSRIESHGWLRNDPALIRDMTHHLAPLHAEDVRPLLPLLASNGYMTELEIVGSWPGALSHDNLDEAMAAASGSGKAEAAAWLLARSQELLAKHDHDGNGTSDVVDDLLL